MAHVKTSYGFWYPQNVSAGGDKVDAQKMFVDNIKLLDAMFKTAVAQHNSVSESDLDTIFDYGIYPVAGEGIFVITGGNEQVKFTPYEGVYVRTYDGSKWGDWYSHSEAALNTALSAQTAANEAKQVLTAQSTTPTSVPAGKFIGVWEE